jgi:hypothetical protein
VVIALLRAGPVRHADDHPPRFGSHAQLLRGLQSVRLPAPDRLRDDTSRAKVQNVRADSSGLCQTITVTLAEWRVIE